MAFSEMVHRGRELWAAARGRKCVGKKRDGMSTGSSAQLESGVTEYKVMFIIV